MIKAHQDLCLDRCGLDEIRKKAFYRVTHRTIPFQCCTNGRKDCTNIRTSRKPTPDTGRLYKRDCCGCTLWMKSYYTPFLSYPESGRHFFKSALPEQHWTLSSLKSYPQRVYVALSISLIKKQDSQNVRQAYISIFRNRINVSDYKQFKSEIICPCEKY